VLARPGAPRAFGGTGRFLISAGIETVFFILLCPIQWSSHTLFLGGLMRGRTVGWNAQVRHAHAVSLADALARLWPQTLTGWAVIGVLAWTNPSALPVALLIAGGLALAVPLAVASAAPGVGRVLAHLGIACLPEEIDRPDILLALAPALRSHRDA
jgi:membrane glycosyltransferase